MVVNPGKNEMIEVEGKRYRRLCIKTHVITDADNITDVVMKYAAPEMQEGDTLFITEKAVACTQKRAIPMNEIKPRPLAKFLCKFVLKTPYGIGLGIPETMEMAIRECGTFRILVAAAVSAVGKLFGIRGWFYKVAGEKARSIDGPCDCTLPPYNEYVVLVPQDENDDEVVILRSEIVDDETEEFVPEEDDSITDAIFEEFKQMFADDYNFADGDEGDDSMFTDAE